MHIRQLQVKNYRSLKDISIGSLSEMVILYGENDSGKSNIISFLEHVFQQKYEVEVTDVPDEEGVIQRPSGFWRGEIDNFSDNFYRNTDEPITFSIRIRFKRREIRNISSLPQPFLDKLRKGRQFDSLKIQGKIEQKGNTNRANMILQEAEFNQKKFFDNKLEKEARFLPDFDLDPGQSLDVFNAIMGKLNNAFLRIPNNRFLTNETEIARNQRIDLLPHHFKNWLFQSSIDRNTEELFRQISEHFNSDPFKHGRISIARVGDEEIEILVEDKHNLKLPIGRKGTGVQQVLIILSYMTESNSPLAGVEELEINLSPKSQTSIFNSLHKLIYHTDHSPISQVFLTTHSPHIAKRDEAEVRGVWLDEEGATQVAKPTEAQIDRFFNYPNERTDPATL